MVRRLPTTVRTPLTPLLLAGAVWLTLGLGASTASAEVFHTGRPIGARRVMAGVEPQLNAGDNGARTLFLHAGLGVGDGVDLGVKWGLALEGSAQRYVGGDVELALLRDRAGVPGISLSLGGHVVGEDTIGVDVAMMLSEPFGRVEPAVGVDADIDFLDDRSRQLVRAIGLLVVRVAGPLRIVGEGGYGFGDTPHHLSFGLQLRL